MKSAKKFLAVIAVFAAIGGFLFSGCATTGVDSYADVTPTIKAAIENVSVPTDGITPSLRDHGIILDDDGEVFARYIYKEGVGPKVQEAFWPSNDAVNIAPGAPGYKISPSFYAEEGQKALYLVPNNVPDGAFAHSGGLQGKRWERNFGGTGQWENEKGAGWHNCNLYFFQPDTPEWELHLTHNWGDAADESASRMIRLADLQRWVDGGGKDPWPPAPEPEEESEGEGEEEAEDAPPSGGS